jgi:hypothetical protein
VADKKLKQELLDKLSNFYGSLYVYSVRKMSYDDIIKNAKYYASRFMERDSDEPFRSPKRENDSTLINLSSDVRMRIYHNSNAVVIKRKMNPLEHLIKEKLDIKQQSEIAINIIKKLELDKAKLPFEQLEFESLWQVNASGITIEKSVAPVTLCRIVGAFRRHINKIPVYGRASIFVKIAGEGLIESVGVDWRPINENPINKVKIINPEIAAEKILENLNSVLPNKVITSDDFKPEFFYLGYFSMPKRQQQHYMQPVYVAMFESLVSKWNRGIVIPAANHVYEPIHRVPEAIMSKKKFKIY